MRTSFHISLKRSTLIFSYPQAGRPITPSFGAKRTSRERREGADPTRMTHSGHRGHSNPAVQQVTCWSAILRGAGPAAPKPIQNNSGPAQGLSDLSAAG